VPLRELDGLVAVVTGAGSGLGRAIAVALAGDGMRVALLGRTDVTLQETATMIEQAGGEAVALVADLRDPGAVGDAVDAAAGRWGGVDVLVNSAAVGVFRSLESTDMAGWDEVIGTNLGGAFAAIHAVLPHLRRRGGGRIVNLASRSAEEGYPYLAAYSASKHGLVGLSESVDTELQDEGIACSALILGSVDTPFHARTIAEGDSAVTAAVLRGAEEASRLPHPDPVGFLDAADVAEVVAFICRLPLGMHLSRLSLRPAHDSGPADLLRMVRRGRAALADDAVSPQRDP